MTLLIRNERRLVRIFLECEYIDGILEHEFSYITEKKEKILFFDIYEDNEN